MFATQPPPAHGREDFLEALLHFFKLGIGLTKEETTGASAIAPGMFEPITAEAISLASAPCSAKQDIFDRTTNERMLLRLGIPGEACWRERSSTASLIPQRRMAIGRWRQELLDVFLPLFRTRGLAGEIDHHRLCESGLHPRR